MKAILSLLLFASCINAAAQSVTTTVKFNKADKPALLLYLPYNQDVAEGTILAKLKETGFEPESKGSLFWKQSKVDGYYVFKGVALRSDSGTATLTDLYFKVERRGSKKDNQSVIYMMTSKGTENFVTASSEPVTFNAAQNFLNGFVKILQAKFIPLSFPAYPLSCGLSYTQASSPNHTGLHYHQYFAASYQR
jgi:hypothetical protein